MGESENYWYHQKVLLKSFPMNGHVGMLRKSSIFEAISVFCLGDRSQSLMSFKGCDAE
jgi:hypothetical protein